MISAVVADVHIWNFPKFGGPVFSGVNQRCSDVLAALSRAVIAANDVGATEFIVAGDLYDADDPSPQVIAATQEILRRFKGDVVLLVGNHDQNTLSDGDHSLGPLAGVGYGGRTCTVIERPEYHDASQTLFAPFDPKPVGEWLPQLLRKHRPARLIAHFGIIDSKTPDYMQDFNDAFPVDELLNLMEVCGTRLAVVGNWHNRGTWSRGKARVEQVGALAPTGFDNQGPDYGQVVITDDTKHTSHRITVPGPRFYKAVWGEDIEQLFTARLGAGDKNYLNVEADQEEIVEARVWLDTRAKELGVVQYDLFPSKAQSVQAAREAGKAASKAVTVLDSIKAYTDKMQVPEGVDRASVLRRMVSYVKGATGAGG